MDIKSTLDSNGLLYANTDHIDNGDKLIFNYIKSQKNYVCKTISSLPSKSVSTAPVEWKFMSKATDWILFETVYEIDTKYPVLLNENHFENEKKVMSTIDLIADNLSKCIMFFNGEPQDKELTIEKFMKNSEGDAANVKITIYGDAVCYRLNFVKINFF
jgi:Odorant response abnormal 4-like